MRIFAYLIFFVLAVVFHAVNAQTNDSFIKVDTAMRNPGVKTPDTLKKADKPAAKAKKEEVIKDSARLALEELPRKAVRRALIVPGWGQITNKRWWKLPFVYGGYVGLGLSINFNQHYYKEFLSEVQYRSEHNDRPPPGSKYPNPEFNGGTGYTTQGLIEAKDFYRRNRDLSILGVLAMHAVQAIDAYVDAKFFRYDISDELSLKVNPSLLQLPPSSYAYSVPVPSLKIILSL